MNLVASGGRGSKELDKKTNRMGFHAPDPGRALFPNQGTNVFNNTTQVLPSSSQPSVSVNPQGAESGEGAESVALFGYFAAIGESYTRCMEAYAALVSSGSIGQ